MSFFIDKSSDRESDSSDDEEVPKFNISAFKKFKSSKSDDSKSIQDVVQKIQQQEKELIDKSLEETRKKSVVFQPGFERLEKVPTFKSWHKKRKEGLKEREKTKGFEWFNMPKTEMTEEKKNDLMVLQMRQALDPKRFYKRSAISKDPKYFQVGTFVESPLEFYSSRVPKKQRKQTLVDELLADAEFRQYQKKKFNEINQALPKKYRQGKKTRKNHVAPKVSEKKKAKGKSKKK